MLSLGTPMTNSNTVVGNPWALFPLFLFLLFFLGSSLYYHGVGTEFAFYQIKAPVAILPAILVALLIGREKLQLQLDTFLKGIGDSNIIMMCVVFLLARG